MRKICHQMHINQGLTFINSIATVEPQILSHVIPKTNWSCAAIVH